MNHRPVFGIGKDEIEEAFDILNAKDENGNLMLDWEELKNRLMTEGEKMSKKEMDTVMKALIGESDMPQQISSDSFAQDVLGFEDNEEE